MALTRAILIAVVLSAAQAGAFDITVEGSTSLNSGELSDLEFAGAIFIDLDEPVLFVGDRRGFFLLPVGTFVLELGPLSFFAPIAAVRFVTGGPGLSTELHIEAALPAGTDLDRISLNLVPMDATDPLSSGSLTGGLQALAAGCCSGSLVLEPAGAQPIYAVVDSLEAVPEPGAEISLALGIVVLVLSRVLRRPHNKPLQRTDLGRHWVV